MMNHIGKVYYSFDTYCIMELWNCDHNTCSDWRSKVNINWFWSVRTHDSLLVIAFSLWRYRHLYSKSPVERYLLLLVFLTVFTFIKLILIGKRIKLRYSLSQYINIGLCLHSLLPSVRPAFEVFNVDCFLPDEKCMNYINMYMKHT